MGRSLLKQKYSIDDLVEIEEPTSLVPLCKEEKEEFSILDSQEEETIRDMCMDANSMVPKLSSLQVLSHHHSFLSMEDEHYTIFYANISWSIRQPPFNF